MSVRKTIDEQIALLREEKAQKENRLNELLQKKKEQEQKARTHRLIGRGAIVESFIPDAETLTNEQIKAFLGKTITSGYAVKILAEIRAQAAENPENSPEQANTL